MVVDGVLLVNMLYVSADDEQPLRTLEESIPFHHLIEAKGLDSGCVSRLKWGLESMNIMLLGVGEAEVKATLSLELLVFSAAAARSFRTRSWLIMTRRKCGVSPESWDIVYSREILCGKSRRNSTRQWMKSAKRTKRSERTSSPDRS